LSEISSLQENTVYESGYYRVIKPLDSDYLKQKGYTVGELVYVSADTDKLTAMMSESRFHFQYDKPEDMEEFAESFLFEPGGTKIRQAEIAALMQEISSVDVATSTMQKQLTQFNPCVTDSGEISETGSELATVADMGVIKKNVATNRNTLVKLGKDIKNKTNQLKRLMEEQTEILALKTKELTTLVERAEESLWSINLYLGRNEQIHVLRTGNPAPVEKKITLRQAVLYMDEECAIAARTEGIDINSIEQFDQWLLESSAHLNRVLYEDKGIVALHVKRYKKTYGNDPWAYNEINKANLHWTYFLIRNGENLYRVFIDLDAGEYLFPTTDSLTNLFHEAKPGSKEYMAAIKMAEESHRHYLRVLLVLQGLLDRTPIFRPAPVERINLCDPAQSSEYVNFVYDSEKQLTDGRPLFDEWLADVNDQLEVGHRIMGTFDYRSGIRGSKANDLDSRVAPTNANSPSSNILHTIDQESDGHFSFKYERVGEKIYTRHGSHNPVNRASCWVEKGDNFFLNFDAVELQDLEYYATHRQSRHLYRDMIKLLEESIKLKKKETADEEPFRNLLVGEMMKNYSVSFEDAAERVPALIRWWKFKNREHRALLSNDRLALDMIVKEFGLRLKNATADQGMHEAVLMSVMPYDPLMVARKKDNIYVVYIPHNDRNIWVCEQEWKFDRRNGSVTMTEESEWQTVDKRHWRWDVLYKSDRWKDWRINPFKNKVLTDPEIEEVQVKAREQLETSNKKDLDSLLFLAVTCDDNFEVRVWFSDQRLQVPALLHSESVTDPNVKAYKPHWEKKSGKITVGKYYSYGSTSTYSFTTEHLPWESNKGQVLWVWPENIERLKQEWRDEKAADARQKEIRNKYRYVTKTLSDQIYQDMVSKAQYEFLLEHGDPELLEDHLRALNITKYAFSILDEALRLYSERGIDPVGQTVAAVIVQARQWGMGDEKSRRGYYDPDYETIPQHLPMDWVIPINVE
jgi:hypothetical protein